MRLNRDQLDKLFIKDNDKVIFNGTSCIVTINKRYETFRLFNIIESGINTLAIFNMHIDGEDYGYILPAVVNMKPSLIEEETSEEEVYKLTFNKGDTFFETTTVVKRTDLIFAIFNMFIFFDIRYPFMTENNISRIFDNFSFTGFNMDYTDSAISSAMFSELYRNPDNIQELNRLAGNVKKGKAIGLKHISLTASKLTTKLSGSYLKENLTAAVIQTHTQESEIENLLRR